MPSKRQKHEIPIQEENPDAAFGQGGGQVALQLRKAKFIVYSDFEGMNTEPQRQALSPNQWHWAENVLILAPNDTRSIPGQGEVLATLTGETISVWYYAFINDIDYIIAFCESGEAWAVNLASGVKTNFADGFSVNPDMTQWEDKRILIFDTTKGYCTWDGTLFVAEGNASPNLVIQSGGEGYDSAPAITISTVSGGAGTGAAATATIEGGTVTEITMTNSGSGYLATDVLLVSFSGGTPTGGGVIGVTMLRNGVGYLTATPTVAFSAPGGGGVTALGTCVIANGEITGVNITNPGSLYLATPTMTFTPAGADAPSIVAVATPIMDTVASAMVVVWPYTIKPATGAVFAGRVWMGLERQLSYTGTNGYDDVDTANAAGTTIISGADLVHKIVALRALNNYLFIVGDKAIKQVGTISVAASITNFNVTTLSSDQGTTFKDSLVSYNRLVMMTNTVGTYAIFGASVEKISDPMLKIFRARGTGITPVSTVFDVYGKHCLLTLVQYEEADGPRSLMLVFQNKKWQVWSQGDNLITIIAAPLLAGTKLYGTSGSDITELVTDLEEPVDITLISALSHNKHPEMGKRAIRQGSAQSSANTNTINVEVQSENNHANYSFQVAQTITWQNNSLQTITWQNNSLQEIQWVVPGFNYYSTTKNVSGIYLGFTMTSTVTEFSFNNFTIEYHDAALFESRNTI